MLSCTHLYHFLPVSINYLRCIHCFLQLLTAPPLCLLLVGILDLVVNLEVNSSHEIMTQKWKWKIFLPTRIWTVIPRKPKPVYYQWAMLTPVNESFVLCWFWITQKLQFFGQQKVSYSDAQQHSPIHSQVRIGYFGQKALHFMYVDRLKWTVDFTPQVHFKFTLRTREYRFMLKMEMLIKSFWPFLYTPS